IDWNHKGSAVDFTDAEYFKTMKASWFMNELVEKHSAIMDQYDPKKEIALIVDEWGAWYDPEKDSKDGVLYQQNTIRDALIAGMNLNIFNNNAARVRMANLAQAVNVLQAVILTQGDKMLLTPTYHVLDLYKVHQDATLLPIEVTSSQFTYEGESLPAVTASASIDAKGKTHISLVNIHPKEQQQITINTGKSSYKKLSGQILTSDNLRDYNSFSNTNKIQPKAFNKAKINGATLVVTLPPFSVVVVEVE
ncbi:MAG: alpha-N-arabinofuranosidase, partial [Flavobacterium sp.]